MTKREVWACLLAFVFIVPLSMSMQGVAAESSTSSVVRVVSPTSAIYANRVLLLNVTFCYGGLRYDLTYNLDGVVEGSIPMGEYQPPNNEFHLINTAYAWVTLPELSDGPHSVTVTLVARVHWSGGGKPGAPFQPTSPRSSEYSATWSDTVLFSVYADDLYETQPQPAIDTAIPEISNLSVQNQTYPLLDVPLSFTLIGNASRVAYSLDGCGNVTIGGNTTLYGLSVGNHNVTVFCWDDASNVAASETIAFTVNERPESSSNPEPFPWLPAAAFSVGLAPVAAMAYLKKRRR